LFYENNGSKIYVDEETKAKLTNDTFFEHTKKSLEIDPKINETIAIGIALKFFDDPVLSQHNSDPFSYWYKDNNSAGRIIIHDSSNFYVNFNENNSISREKLSHEELTRIAEDLIIKYRGNISDLRVDHISGSKMSMGNSRTGKETFLGYGDYIVSFAQYTDGIKVTGERGKIMIRIDPFGKPNYCQDSTIRKFNITDYKYKIKTPMEILKEFSEKKDNDNSYTLEDIDLVFDFYSNHAYLEYQLVVKARTKYYSPEMIYIDA